MHSLFLSRALTGVGEDKPPLAVDLAEEWCGMLRGGSEELMSGLCKWPGRAILALCPLSPVIFKSVTCSLLSLHFLSIKYTHPVTPPSVVGTAGVFTTALISSLWVSGCQWGWGT